MTRTRPVDRIVSGGQTGVDRAALDVALALRIPCGGWCPRGRRAEDGPIAAHYPLVETPSAAYLERTRLNVRDSDATLVLAWGNPKGGTRRTVGFAMSLGRPVLVLDLDAETQQTARDRAAAWLADLQPATLNVAGPRESGHPGAHAATTAFLRALFGEADRKPVSRPAARRRRARTGSASGPASKSSG